MNERIARYLYFYIFKWIPLLFRTKKIDRGSKRKGKNMAKISGDVKRQRQKNTEREGPHKQVRWRGPRSCKKAAAAKKNGSGRGTSSVDKRTAISLEVKVNFLSPELSRGSSTLFLQHIVLSFFSTQPAVYRTLHWVVPVTSDI
jgi:hypothetical protein